jgi:hypothetical protein
MKFIWGDWFLVIKILDHFIDPLTKKKEEFHLIFSTIYSYHIKYYYLLIKLKERLSYIDWIDDQGSDCDIDGGSYHWCTRTKYVTPRKRISAWYCRLDAYTFALISIPNLSCNAEYIINAAFLTQASRRILVVSWKAGNTFALARTCGLIPETIFYAPLNELAFTAASRIWRPWIEWINWWTVASL